MQKKTLISIGIIITIIIAIFIVLGVGHFIHIMQEEIVDKVF